MLRAHRSTFKPASGCTPRFWEIAQPISFGSGVLSDANFDLNDDFVTNLNPDGSELQFQIPSEVSKITVYLTSDGNISYCATTENPCENGNELICSEGSPCCPACNYTYCDSSNGNCYYPVCDGEVPSGAASGGCWKEGDHSSNCNVCGKSCCNDACAGDCTEGPLCWDEDCPAPGSPIDDCDTQCVQQVKYACLGSGTPKNDYNPGCAGEGAGTCTCLEVGCDQWEAYQNAGYELFDFALACQQFCVPRWYCCNEGTCLDYGDNGICPSGSLGGPLFCSQVDCNDPDCGGCPTGLNRVVEGDILTTEQTTFVNKGKFTLTTATPITAKQAAVYNARIAQLETASLVPDTIFSTVTGIEVSNVKISDSGDQNSPFNANCNVCEGENPPGGGNPSVSCPAPEPTVIIFEYDVNMICSSIPLTLVFRKVSIAKPTGQFWNEENDVEYIVELKTGDQVLLTDKITRGHTELAGNNPGPVFDCQTCQFEFDCAAATTVVNGQYLTFNGESGYPTADDGIQNEKKTTVRINGTDFVIQTTIVAAGKELKVYTKDGDPLPIIYGGASNNFESQADWSNITNQLRWNSSRRKSEYLGNTYIAGESAGALQGNYAINGEEPPCLVSGSIEAGPALYGVVCDDAGWTFQSNPGGFFYDYNNTSDIVQHGVYSKVLLRGYASQVAIEYNQFNSIPGIYDEIFTTTPIAGENVITDAGETAYGKILGMRFYYGDSADSTTIANYLIDVRSTGITAWTTFSASPADLTTDLVDGRFTIVESGDYIEIDAGDGLIEYPNIAIYDYFGSDAGDIEFRVRKRPSWQNQIDGIAEFSMLDSTAFSLFSWVREPAIYTGNNVPDLSGSNEYLPTSEIESGFGIKTRDHDITVNSNKFSEYIAVYCISSSINTPTKWAVYKLSGFDHKPHDRDGSYSDSGRRVSAVYNEFVESSDGSPFSIDNISGNSYRMFTLNNYNVGDIEFWNPYDFSYES